MFGIWRVFERSYRRPQFLGLEILPKVASANMRTFDLGFAPARPAFVSTRAKYRSHFRFQSEYSHVSLCLLFRPTVNTRSAGEPRSKRARCLGRRQWRCLDHRPRRDSARLASNQQRNVECFLRRHSAFPNPQSEFLSFRLSTLRSRPFCARDRGPIFSCKIRPVLRDCLTS